MFITFAEFLMADDAFENKGPGGAAVPRQTHSINYRYNSEATSCLMYSDCSV